MSLPHWSSGCWSNPPKTVRVPFRNLGKIEGFLRKATVSLPYVFSFVCARATQLRPAASHQAVARPTNKPKQTIVFTNSIQAHFSWEGQEYGLGTAKQEAPGARPSSSLTTPPLPPLEIRGGEPPSLLRSHPPTRPVSNSPCFHLTPPTPSPPCPYGVLPTFPDPSNLHPPPPAPPFGYHHLNPSRPAHSPPPSSLPPTYPPALTLLAPPIQLSSDSKVCLMAPPGRQRRPSLARVSSVNSSESQPEWFLRRREEGWNDRFATDGPSV